jgi:hypothetical protein
MKLEVFKAVKVSMFAFFVITPRGVVSGTKRTACVRKENCKYICFRFRLYSLFSFILTQYVKRGLHPSELLCRYRQIWRSPESCMCVGVYGFVFPIVFVHSVFIYRYFIRLMTNISAYKHRIKNACNSFVYAYILTVLRPPTHSNMESCLYDDPVSS